MGCGRRRCGTECAMGAGRGVSLMRGRGGCGDSTGDHEVAWRSRSVVEPPSAGALGKVCSGEDDGEKQRLDRAREGRCGWAGGGDGDPLKTMCCGGAAEDRPGSLADAADGTLLISHHRARLLPLIKILPGSSRPSTEIHSTHNHLGSGGRNHGRIRRPLLRAVSSGR